MLCLNKFHCFVPEFVYCLGPVTMDHKVLVPKPIEFKHQRHTPRIPILGVTSGGEIWHQLACQPITGLGSNDVTETNYWDSLSTCVQGGGAVCVPVPAPLTCNGI